MSVVDDDSESMCMPFRNAFRRFTARCIEQKLSIKSIVAESAELHQIIEDLQLSDSAFFEMQQNQML